MEKSCTSYQHKHIKHDSVSEQKYPKSVHLCEQKLDAISHDSNVDEVELPTQSVKTSFSFDVLQCGGCGHSAHSLLEFLNHKISHASKTQPVGCALCGQSYNKQVFLRDHYKKKHNIKFPKDDRLEKINRKQIIDDSMRDITVHSGKLKDVPAENQSINICSSNSFTVPSNDEKLNTIHVVITKTNEQIDHVNLFEVGNSENESLMSTNTTSTNEEDLSMHSEKSIPVENAEMNVDNQSYDNCVENITSNIPNSKQNQLMLLTNSSNLKELDFHFILMNNIIKGKKFPYGKNGFKCLHCDYKTSWRMSLCKHMSVEHSDMMAIHQYIEIKSPELDANQKFLKMSEYLSDIQKAKEKRVKNLRGVESQDKPGHFACKQCDKVFNRLRYLRKHRDIHKTDSKYLCDECGKAFKTKNYLAAHRRTHKNKAFCCTQCSFTSNVNSLIHAHRQVHREGSVLCDVCGQAYLDNSTLKKHKRVHDLSRPFACTFQGCTWRFNKEVLCQAHVKSHTTVGQYVCSICNYSFRHKHHLQRHQNKIHGASISLTNKPPKNVDDLGAEVLSNIDENNTRNTVDFVLGSEISSDQLESAIQQGNLVISSTDVEGNTVNYVTYHAMLEEGNPTDVGSQTIVVPHNEGNQIIFQQ